MNIVNINDKLKFNGVRTCCVLNCEKVACKKLQLTNYDHVSFPVFKYFCFDCAPDDAKGLDA